MPMVEAADGTRLYVKDWGDGPAVVLIHGWPLSADSWDDQAWALVDHGYRVISYDRRGFGRSDQPWSGYDYDTLADDLAAVIRARGVTDPALVGFSMGGGEVARYLSRHGGARAAALVGSVVPFLLQTHDHPEGAPETVFEEMKAGIREDRPKFLREFFKGFYGVGMLSSPVSEAVLDWSFQVAMQAGLPGTLACIDSFGRTDFRPDLAAFTMPTLVIHGTGDAIVPIDITGRAVARAVPGARLIEIDGAPHGLLASHGEEVTKDLIAFLDG